MKVLIVNTFDKGGAANACLRLHEGLIQQGVESKVLLKHKQKSLQQTYEFNQINKPKSKFQLIKHKCLSFFRVIGLIKKPKETPKQQFFKHRQLGLELFSFPESSLDITSSPLYNEADIINLHWVSNFLDYDSFFRNNTKPIVWTLHDMNPFTGGEHYLETFLGMDTSGNPIPRILTNEEQLVANKNLILKQKAIKYSSNINIVAPSKWLCQAAKNSTVFKALDVHCIPYGINSEIFQPRDQNYSRNILNIPKDKTVFLFVADSIDNHRKGYAYLKKALKMMQNDDVVLCAVGSKNSGLDSFKNIIELGNINDELLMSIAYSAADVFVIPSLMDNLPNTVLESLMCGTPVIGFPVGGITDMIKNEQNGLLAKSISSQSLLECLEQFLKIKSSFNNAEISLAAKEKYDLSIQANAYIKLYSEILKKEIL